MSDRELLELAAKAIGYSDVRVPYGSDKIHAWMPLPRSYNEIVGTYTVDYGHREWDPLNDDGDALRLMVKLNMDFTLSGKHAAVTQVGRATAQAFCNGDPYAATRRAIVRAAAEIGKGIQLQTVEGLLEDNYYKSQAEQEPVTDEEIDKLCPQFDDPTRREMWIIGFKAAHNIK